MAPAPKLFHLRAHPARRTAIGWVSSIRLFEPGPTTDVLASTPDVLNAAIEQWGQTIGRPDERPDGDEPWDYWSVTVWPDGRWPAGFKARFSDGVFLVAAE